MKKIAFAALFLIMIPNNSIVRAKISDWQKGVSIYPRSPEDFGSQDTKTLFERIASDNANYATFVIPLYQGNHHSAAIFSGIDTPTDESIIQGIKWAHDNKLAVMLKPHLDSDDTIWRANISPRDRDAWFTSYENMLLHYAEIGQKYHVEQICIGTELISVAAGNVNPDNTTRWKKMIADLRLNYGGLLSYSANWGPDGSSFANEKDHIGFWQDLDFVGISAYFQLHTKDNSVESLKTAWDAWNRTDIEPLAVRSGKPILFTEVGFRSSKNAHLAPYEYQNKSVYDPQEQINSYQAMFEYWQDKPYVAGVSIWNFYSDPNAGGEGNTDYTPQGKPAEQVLKDWFAPPEQATSNEDKNFFGGVGNFFRSVFRLHLI
ncbi:MAG: hypothetical protein KW788_04450 [Candidatus Doudnabacteria bacterium]|nr:hypothetical protein [Candidatus Doudnabacteria bacterium]